MCADQFTRRHFLKNSLSIAALIAIPGETPLAQTPPRRLEWQDFVKTSDYASFVNGIRNMRANSNAASPTSWAYWSNIHVKYCPHGIAYFLAWHRGYLYHFERQLRLASGNSHLLVPYWDYYKSSRIPRAFTDSASSPLYIPGRVNTVVQGALTLTPFSSQYSNFQRGTVNSYEASFEGRPHNPIHNIIGGAMASMTSPMDPVFWLHHANVDRLWAAWVTAGGTRTMPASASSYWNGTFTYATGLTLSRRQTINTTGLLYSYQSLSLPTSIPPLAQRGQIIRAQFDPNQNRNTLRRPPVLPLLPSGARNTGPNRHSIGGAKEIHLDENPVSARISIQNDDRLSLQSVLENLESSPFGRARTASAPYRSVQVILDNLRVTAAGKNGGYFYNVYLNLPDSSDTVAAEQRYCVGNFGAFEISGAVHHADVARLVLPATRLLANAMPTSLDEMTVSLVRVDGENSAKGVAVIVGEIRIELTDDDIE